MGLLSPWFLAGLLAVGLPLWLHLLKQITRNPRPFSSLMFFERRVQSSTRHRRLRYLALLALRVAVLALLALAFANPFVYRRQEKVIGRTLTVIAIDRSFSMRAAGSVEAAKREAHRILDARRGRIPVQVLAFDSHVEDLTAPETDKSAVSAAIDSIAANDAASSYGELTRALWVLEQTSGARLDVHIITDAQQTSMPASFKDLQAGPHTSETLHVVGKPSANWAVESVSAPARIFGSATANISATISGWNGPTATKKVSLLIDGRTVATQSVNLQCQGRATSEFHNVALPYGAHRGEVRLESHDNLPEDDRYFFAMEREDPRKVLFLYASGRQRESFYYKSALESSAATGLTVQSFPIERLNTQRLADYAFVVLNDPGDLDDAVARQLTAYVNKGGAILIAVGPATANTGRVAISGNQVDPRAMTQSAGAIDKESPELSGLGKIENALFLQTPKIVAKDGDRVLARFADGSPLLIVRRLGEGRIMTFASTLDNTASDFPLHSSFLPFVAQTAASLSRAEDAPSSVVAGTPVVLRRSREEYTAADVIGPNGKHELSLRDSTRAMSYDLANAGFYEVQRASGHRFLIAANADRRESDLTRVPAETLALWHSVANDSATAAATVEHKIVPWSLWRYALLLLLAAALAESLFAGRYFRQER